MNETIYKYTLYHSDEQIIELPKGSKILSIQYQKGNLRLWAQVNPDNIDVDFTIFMVGTGRTIPNVPVRYISTAQQAGGDLIWHFYQRL